MPVTAIQYQGYTGSTNICYYMFEQTSQTNEFRIGDVFYRLYYSVFNVGASEIGLGVSTASEFSVTIEDAPEDNI